MKATAAISIAALVAALAATPSMALDLNAGLGASAGVNASSDEDNASAGAALGADLNASAQGGDGSEDGSVSTGGSVDAGAAVGPEAGDLGVDTNTTGAINASASDASLDAKTRLDLLVKLINESTYDASSFSAWTDASVTNVIKTDDLFDFDGKAKIDAAIQANLDEHNDLEAAINANAALKAWLDSNGIDASSVIAIDVGADGSVEVYEG